MATRTTYYELIKPSQTDLVDVRDLNTNFDNIDAIMHTNEANIDALGDRTTVAESDIDDLQESTEHLSDGDTVYPYASEIEIEDALGVNAKDVSVKITAQQDLHGYDHPWAGGAGKNKLPMTVAGIKSANTSGTWSGNTYTYNGVTFTIMTDNDGNVTGINANGSASAECIFTISTYNVINLPSGDYAVNGCPSGGSSYSYRLRGSNSLFGDLGDGTTFSLPKTGVSASNVQIVIADGYTANNLIFYPMIRLSTETDDTFEPYTNICSISGWDECEVGVNGKNLLDNKAVMPFVLRGVTFTQNPDGSITANGTATNGDVILTLWSRATNNVHLPSGQYTYKACPSGGSAGTYYCQLQCTRDGSLHEFGSDYGNGVTANILDTDIMQTTIRVRSGVTVNNVTFYPQLEKGSIATNYEPYVAPHAYIIQLGDTIYSGILDVTNGVLTVTHGIIDLGTKSWTYRTSEVVSPYFETNNAISDCKANSDLICNQYDNIMPTTTNTDNAIIGTTSTSKFRVRDTNYTDATTFVAGMDGVKAVYELATTITVQLTPQQIQLIEGYNLISANTGDISITTTDIKGAIKQADALIEANTKAIEDLTDFDLSIFGTVENGTTASKAYAQGDYFVKDKKMCKALTSIAQGATFTLGTNYAAYTLADILKAIEQS